MKIAANPAATSSDAGTSASSSRLRALMSRASLDLTALERGHEVLGVILRAQLVVRERLAAIRWHGVDRHARAGGTRVELDPERQVVGQPWEDGDRAVVARIGADEVDGARGHPAAGQDQEGDDEGDDETDWDAPTALAARLWAGLSRERGGATRCGGFRRRLLGRLGLAAGADRRQRDGTAAAVVVL